MSSPAPLALTCGTGRDVVPNRDLAVERSRSGIRDRELEHPAPILDDVGRPTFTARFTIFRFDSGGLSSQMCAGTFAIALALSLVGSVFWSLRTRCEGDLRPVPHFAAKLLGKGDRQIDAHNEGLCRVARIGQICIGMRAGIDRPETWARRGPAATPALMMAVAPFGIVSSTTMLPLYAPGPWFSTRTW